MDLLHFLLFVIQLEFALVVLFLLWRVIVKDYRAFINLGPGGTPSTPLGYLRVCMLKMFALKNPLIPPLIPTTLSPQIGILKELAQRNGPRPKVLGIAPQRQQTQKIGKQMYNQLVEAIRELAAYFPESLFLGTSCFEKHSEGIFSIHRADPDRFTCRGEVCHSHPSDGSMHLTLHPADVRVVLECGWGERHPIARNHWWRLKLVPAGFVLVYAPRNEEELETIMQIVRAAAWWIGGEEFR